MLCLMYFSCYAFKGFSETSDKITTMCDYVYTIKLLLVAIINDSHFISY